MIRGRPGTARVPLDLMSLIPGTPRLLSTAGRVVCRQGDRVLDPSTRLQTTPGELQRDSLDPRFLIVMGDGEERVQVCPK